MRTATLTSALCLALLSPALGAEPLSRAQVVEAALAANPDVVMALEDLAILRGRGREALADALPEIQLLGIAQRFRDPALLNSSSFDAFPPELRDSLAPIPANLYDGMVTVRQTLFSFRLGAAIRAARHAIHLGEEQVRQARQDVALEAVHAYDAYLLALAKVDVAGKALRQKQVHLENARNRRAAGVATELDVLRSEVDVENARALRIRFEGEAAEAAATINAVMVRDVDTPIEPTDSLDYEPFDVELQALVKEAWAERPEVKAALATEKAYEEFVTVARADGRPRLDFDGSFGWSVRQTGNFFQGDYQRWAAQVKLTVPLFDGWRTRGKVAQAQAEVGKRRQETRALDNRVRLQAQQAVTRLRSAKSLLEAAELSVTQARRALEMTQANYKAGAATTLDVLDAQAALTLAESTRVEALHAHAGARAFARYVMGRSPLAGN
jgi:HAE1 family hydrophobic/amphiphilic exporter-1